MHRTRPPRLPLTLLALLCVLPAVPVVAQTTTPVPPTSIKVLVIADVGDPGTLPALATNEVPISATSGLCNKVKDVGVAGLTNPAYSFFDDPFNANRGCFVPNPPGLPNGKYRTVGIMVAASCIDIATGQPKTNCEAPRSAPSLVFTVAPIQINPAAATGWGVKQ